jgi:CubicO group peptidase (beta-lactamase class C family)
MTIKSAAPLLAAIVLAGVLPGCAKPVEQHAEAAVDAERIMRQRAAAIIAALSDGDAGAYEKAASENYSPEFLARRTPQDHATFVEMVHSDFGRLEIRGITLDGADLRVEAGGGDGQIAIFVFSFDKTPERRILRIGIEAQASDQGGEEDPSFPPPPVSAGMTASDMTAALEGWLAPFIEHDDFAGVVLVAHQGEPFVAKAYGLADRKSKRAATIDTTYNIASIGKKFTQTEIAKLIENGQLTRQTTVGEILPDYPNEDAKKATIQQLISMQGGVSDFFGPEFEAKPKSQFASNHDYFEFVSTLPQRFVPGSSREYCNGCYIVLGEMVERVSGEAFEVFVQRHVFNPASMKRSGYFHADRLPDNTALLYGRTGGPETDYADVSGQHGVAGSGAGGGYATAKDLLAFDKALRDGRLLDPEMTAWVLGGATLKDGRNMTPMAIAGGAPGTSALLESNGEWAVIVTANVSEPLPERIGVAIARELVK